jgi:glutathione S-transferase
LEEKKIPYKIEKINMRCYGEKPASFMKMQPGGQIPVVIIDGVTYGQSNDILWALEEGFEATHKSLKPPKEQTETAQRYFRLERQLFSVWMQWLTGNGGERAKRDFVEVLQDVEIALSKSSGPFFLGNDISQVDVMFTPFLERMAASLLYYKGFMMRVPPDVKTDYPNLNKWFDVMETLPSYQLTKSDYYTHCWDLPPQVSSECKCVPAGNVDRNCVILTKSSRYSWEDVSECLQVPHLKMRLMGFVVWMGPRAAGSYLFNLIMEALNPIGPGLETNKRHGERPPREFRPITSRLSDLPHVVPGPKACLGTERR